MPEHADAIRAVGITDTPRAKSTVSGYGRNAPEVVALAEQAKEALGGYYREFLLAKPVEFEWRQSCECVDAGAPVPSLVLDPFAGIGTTGLAATKLMRDAILIEAHPPYAEIAEKRLREAAGLLASITRR